MDAGEEDMPYLCIAQMSDTKGLTYLVIESIKREIEKYLYAPGTFDYIQFANQHLKVTSGSVRDLEILKAHQLFAF